jgi:hypothetical protein
VLAESFLPGVDIPLPDEPPPDDWSSLPRNGSRRSDGAPPAANADLGAVVDGARFILDAPPQVAPIWGDGSRVLWASGEALMIAGPQGLGKTTLAGLLVKALLGAQDDVLGLPVTPSERRVLYLAMDRPRQISRSLRRQFSEADRDRLADRLIVRQGPPPADLAAQPHLLAAMAEAYGAGVVIVDSLKDAAVGLSDDTVGASYNRARQRALAAGCEVAELHHTVKRGPGGGPPSTVADIYGSTWLTSGAGSIVLLSGDPGDPIVGMRHVKQPAEEVGPYRLLHDQTAGLLTVEHAADFVAMARACGPDGLTARTAAAALTDKPQPGRADIEKARRKLDALAASGVLMRLDGGRGGTGEQRSPAAYFIAPEAHCGQSRPITPGGKTAGQANHGHSGDFDPHAGHGPITAKPKTAGQANHTTNHANHGAGNHVSPPLFRGGERD